MSFSVTPNVDQGIIVNQHKKSRVFLYSFNTLILPERYCILFLYQYNGDNKRKKEPDVNIYKKKLKEWSGKRKSAQRAEYGGQTNGSI